MSILTTRVGEDIVDSFLKPYSFDRIYKINSTNEGHVYDVCKSYDSICTFALDIIDCP